MEIAIFYSKRIKDLKVLSAVKEYASKIPGEAQPPEIRSYPIPKTGIVKLLIKLKLGQTVLVLDYKLSSEEKAMLLEMTPEVYCASIESLESRRRHEAFV
jgi:hypothetical protein